MFEKEAKERARKLEENQTLGVYENYEDYARDIGWNDGEVAGYEEGFKDGAEFGYNKANEWHDLRKDPNDLPDNGRSVLVKDKSRREYDVACLCRSKDNSDFWSYERFISRVSDNYVIAWCELPKFEQ